jgi:vacuolar-type H+-ATPase subunit I/STV1
VQQETRLRGDKIQQVIAFLSEYDLIMVDERKEKVKLRKVVQQFLTKTTP